MKLHEFGDDRELGKFLAGQAFEAIEKWNEENDHGLQINWMMELSTAIADNIMWPSDEE